jgi:hypothetical protein
VTTRARRRSLGRRASAALAALGIAASVVLGAAAPVAAQSFVVRGTDPPTAVWDAAPPGPALAGDHVVWPETTGRLTVRLFAADAGSRVPRLLAAVRRPPGRANAVYARADGGPSRISLRVEHGFCGERCFRDGEEPVAATALAGPLDDLRPLGPDASDPRFQRQRAPMPAGDHVAYWARGGATFVDPLTGERLVAGGYPAAVAGDLLVSYPQLDRPSVVEWRTGRELYAPRLERGGWPTSIQADGRVLWRSCCDRYRLTSPDDPAGRDVPLPGARSSPPPLLAGDRIAYSTRRELVVADLAGRRIAAARSGPRTADGTPFDFDGRRLAWLAQPCALGHVAVWHLGSRPPRVAAGRCRGALPAGRPVLRGRRLALALRCPTRARQGCAVEAWLEVHRRNGDVLAATRAVPMLAPGELRRGTVSLDLPPGALRDRRLRVKLVTAPLLRAAPGERRVRWFPLRVR